MNLERQIELMSTELRATMLGGLVLDGAGNIDGLRLVTYHIMSYEVSTWCMAMHHQDGCR